MTVHHDLINSHNALQKQLETMHERYAKLTRISADLQRENEVLKKQLKKISIILRKGIDAT